MLTTSEDNTGGYKLGITISRTPHNDGTVSGSDLMIVELRIELHIRLMFVQNLPVATAPVFVNFRFTNLPGSPRLNQYRGNPL